MDSTKKIETYRIEFYGYFVCILMLNSACTRGGLLSDKREVGAEEQVTGLETAEEHDIKINRVSPIEGVVTGGTRITIYGAGFKNNNTTVRVGSGSCRNLMYLSELEISCVTPSGNIGAVDIEVFNLPTNRQSTAKLSDRLEDAFTYFLPVGGSLIPMIAFSASGGVSEGSGMQMRGTLGQPVGSGDRTGFGVQLKSGFSEATRTGEEE